MPVSIFNYAESKIPLMNYLVENYLERHHRNKYYLDNDWEGGPNTLIIFSDPADEQKAVQEITDLVEQYKQYQPVESGRIAELKQKYKKNQRVLKQLELRGSDSEHVIMRNDGVVEIRSRKNNVFNSDYHQQMFEKYRLRLNGVYIKLLSNYENLDRFHSTHMFIGMFYFLTSLYSEGKSRGYLSFLSHVEGFFSRLRLEGYDTDMKSEFEKRRSHIMRGGKIVIHEDVHETMEEWKNEWLQIAEEMNTNFDLSNYKDDLKLGLDDQYDMFVKNISPLDNNFHSTIVHDEQLKEFILSKQMLVFRDIVNLFYLSLPIFEQSMVKKQFYAYCTVKQVEDEENGNLPFVID
ncbi:hypothetical protein [Paenibacillus sp. TSA_86.1]|uniref:hypothetical protein n=1 Tax=Paenibacillus sp. TSA_86.1 TaxID=3415649 RepID=UPI004045600B